MGREHSELVDPTSRFDDQAAQPTQAGLRRRFLEELLRVHQADKLQVFGEHAALADAKAFKAWLAPLRKCEWVVYAKRPFAGPQAVLTYLSRDTHRVAISNSRLIRRGVTVHGNE